MPSFIQSAIEIETSQQDRSVSKKQREVYDWYERCHSDDEVVDIYSPEWQQRITSWYNWLTTTTGTRDVHVNVIEGCDNLDDLDLGPFFFARPVAAFSLWHVLQACYEMDEAVCERTEKVLNWRELKPFAYLKSKEVKKMWKQKLKHLGKRIKNGKLNGEALKSKLCAIHHGVEKLEDSVNSLDGNFGDDFKNTKLGSSMLKRIHEVVDYRCLMIASSLNIDGKDSEYEATMSDEEAINHGSLADPTHRVPSPAQVNNGDDHLDPFVQRPDIQENYISYGVAAVVIFQLLALSALKEFWNIWGK